MSDFFSNLSEYLQVASSFTKYVVDVLGEGAFIKALVNIVSLYAAFLIPTPTPITELLVS